MPKLETSAVN